MRRDQQRPRLEAGEATPGGCRQESRPSTLRPGFVALLRLLLQARGLTHAERVARHPDHVCHLPERIPWRLFWMATGATPLGAEAGALGQGRSRQTMAVLPMGRVAQRPVPQRPGPRQGATPPLKKKSHVDVERVPC